MVARISRSNPADAGFSLIELTIVVTLLSILTLSVGLSMSLGRSTGSNDDVAVFQKRFDQLRAAAIHTRRPHGLQVTPQGWQVVGFDAQTGAWDFSGRQFDWKRSASFRPRPRGGVTALGRQPDVVFLPTGQSSAFEIRFITAQGFHTCQSDGWTGMSCDPG